MPTGHLSSGEMFIKVSCSFFFLGLHFFLWLLLSCMSCLCILEIKHLLDASFTNISLILQVVCVLFSVQKLISLVRSLCLFLFLLPGRMAEENIDTIYIGECFAYAFFQGRSFMVLYLFFFKLEDNCFTMLYWFLPYSNANQSQLYIYLVPLKPLSHLQGYVCL